MATFFILAHPDISIHLARELVRHDVQVVVAESMDILLKDELHCITVGDLSSKLAENPSLEQESLFILSSENALEYLSKLIPNADIIKFCSIFKNKPQFREGLSIEFPTLFFKEYSKAEILTLNPASVPFPLIVKPSIGVASIGVIRVESPNDWADSISSIFDDIDLHLKAGSFSPTAVSGHSILCEACIEGQELAIDGYFNRNGEPVILQIAEHLFLNAQDFSDRIYLTHRELVKANLSPIKSLLEKIARVWPLRSFPFHMELRVTGAGEFIPIEINPLRFIGLEGSEITLHAFHFNTHQHFFQQTEPDWPSILAAADASVYALFAADMSTDTFLNHRTRLSIDHEALKREFREVLDYRPVDDVLFALVYFRVPTVADCLPYLSLDVNPFVHVAAPQ